MATRKDEPTRRDVFIVFSKSVPIEARFALAAKDGLEQMGRFAYEYENWAWFDSTAPAEEVDINRPALQSMLKTAKAVLVILPFCGRPSDGVAIELNIVAEMGSPVILLRWDSPKPQFKPENLNVIYRYQVHGRQPNERWIASAGVQLGEIGWLACAVSELRNEHGAIGNLLLDALPAFGSQPLTSFKLRAGLVHADDFLREPDLNAVAQLIAQQASRGELQALFNNWRCDWEPVLRFLGTGGCGQLRRPSHVLYKAMHSVERHAEQRFPDLTEMSADTLYRRGTQLARFMQNEEAIKVLTAALPLADDHSGRIYAMRAQVYASMGDLKRALADLDEAVAIADNSREESIARFNRAIMRATHETDEAHQAAITDLTRVLELTDDEDQALKALNYRGLHYAALGSLNSAIADWTRVLDRATEQPRAAAQAWLNRGASLRQQGRLEDAVDDWTSVLSWADASDKQRFRALEARAAALESLGQPAAAADDIVELLTMGQADPQWSAELREKVEALRALATEPPEDA